MKLTEEIFDEIPAGSVFAAGIEPNSPDGIYMTTSDMNRLILWVAQKGYGDDWTIYLHWIISGFNFVLSQGDKTNNKETLRKLVNCTDEVFKKYRY